MYIESPHLCIDLLALIRLQLCFHQAGWCTSPIGIDDCPQIRVWISHDALAPGCAAEHPKSTRCFPIQGLARQLRMLARGLASLYEAAKTPHHAQILGNQCMASHPVLGRILHSTMCWHRIYLSSSPIHSIHRQQLVRPNDDTDDLFVLFFQTLWSAAGRSGQNCNHSPQI